MSKESIYNAIYNRQSNCECDEQEFNTCTCSLDSKKYHVRTSILNMPIEMWDKYQRLHSDGDYFGTPQDFLNCIGLPSSLSTRTNEQEKEFFETIYNLGRL